MGGARGGVGGKGTGTTGGKVEAAGSSVLVPGMCGGSGMYGGGGGVFGDAWSGGADGGTAETQTHFHAMSGHVVSFR